MGIQDITPGPAQLKAMVDLCHLYGIAVAFDVVYNHAGGFMKATIKASTSMIAPTDTSDNNQSLYFTNHGAGGRSFLRTLEQRCPPVHHQ